MEKKKNKMNITGDVENIFVVYLSNGTVKNVTGKGAFSFVESLWLRDIVDKVEVKRATNRN